MTTTIQVRLDTKTKRDAQKVFKEMGIDLSSGVKLFLNEVLRTQALPFTPRTKNGFTEAQERELVRETEYALVHGKRHKNVHAMHQALLRRP